MRRRDRPQSEASPSRHIEQLERRRLYSADVAPWLVDPGVDDVEAPAPVWPSDPVDLDPPVSPETADAPKSGEDGLRIVLIDRNLEDVDVLAGAVDAGATLVLFDADREDVTQVLAEVRGLAGSLGEPIASLSVLTHGSEGRVAWGPGGLTADMSEANAEAWRDLSAHLVSGADISFFGCDVAGDVVSGQALLDRVADLTGADVFASDDVTGRGGDWILEAASSGADDAVAETGLVSAALETWSGQLVDHGEAGFSGSGTWDDGAIRFGIDVTGPGTIDFSYDGASDTLSISGSAGTDDSTRVVLSDLNGGLVVGTLRFDADLAELSSDADVSSLTVEAGATVDRVVVGGGGGRIGSVHVGGAPSGAMTLEADVGQLVLASITTADVQVTGDLEVFDAGAGFDGTLRVDAALGALDVEDGGFATSIMNRTQAEVVYDGTTQSLTATVTSLVGHWTFDGDATDDGPGGYDGTLQGGEGDEFVPGQVGSHAFDPDGIDDMIVTGSGDVPVLAGDYTTSVWIRPDPVQNDWAGIYTATNATGSVNHWNLQFDETPDRQLVSYLENGSQQWQTGIYLDDLDDGAWHHLVVHREGTTMTLWVDGVAVATATDVVGPVAVSDHLNIGGDRTGRDQYKFTGGIDDLRVYDRALTHFEVGLLYGANSAPTATPGTTSLPEDGSVVVSIGGTDPDAGDSIDRVRIDSLPVGGLLLSGGAVSVGDEISRLDIDAGLLTYEPPADWNGDTSFEFSVNDGHVWSSGSATFAITVTPENDAPVLDLDANDDVGAGLDYQASFTEGLGPVAVADSDASITDIDGDVPVAIRITVDAMPDGALEALSADVTGTALNATWDAGSRMLTLDGSGTQADFEQVLRTVTYDNASLDPTTTDRLIRFVVDDGSDPSTVATTTVGVVATNTPAAFVDQSFDLLEGPVAGSLVGTVAASDPDGSGVLSYQIVSGNSDGAFSLGSGTGELRVVDGAALDHETVGSRVLRVRVTDDGGLQTEADVTVHLLDANESPWVSMPSGQTLAPGETITFSSAGVNAIAIGDLDAGDGLVEVTLSVTAGELSLGSTAGLHFLEGDGVADAHMRFEGTLSQVNTALDGAAFTALAIPSGTVTMSLAVDDLGGVGAGGPLTGQSSVSIEVAPIAVDPLDDEDASEPEDEKQSSEDEPTEAEDEKTAEEPTDDEVTLDDDTSNTSIGEDETTLLRTGPAFDPLAREDAGAGSDAAQLDGVSISQSANVPLIGSTEGDLSGSLLSFTRDDDEEDIDEASRLAAGFADAQLQDALHDVETQLRETADRQQDEIEVKVRAVERTGLAFSAAVLAMITRGTSLLAIAVSALPVWSRVDPLAVLAVSESARRANRREQRDVEALEGEANSDLASMLDEAAVENDEDDRDDEDEARPRTERRRA